MGSVANIEGEQALLGALLLDNEVLGLIGFVRPEHFYEPVHERIFTLASKLIQGGKLASPITMKLALAGDVGLQELGGTDYLARLVGTTISTGAAPEFAEELVGLYARRHVIEAAEGAIAIASGLTDEYEPDQAIQYLDEALATARHETSRKPPTMTFAKALAGAMQAVDEAIQRGTGVDIPTGIPELDEALGGFSDDEMIVLGGRPSMGKTALAIEIVRRQARAGLSCVYWSGEMSEQSIATRMVSTESKAGGASYHNAARGRLGEEQFRTMLVAARAMEALPIRLIDPGIRYLPTLIGEIRRNVRQIRGNGGKIGCVVVDYIQQIQAPGKARFDQVTEISMALAALKMELRCPILALAQLSRRLEDRENKRPNLNDLRESGQIEQDGNKVLFCYRDEYYLERRKPGAKTKEIIEIEGALAGCRGVMEIVIAKQRSGPIKTVRVGYDAAFNRIYSLDQGHDDQESFI